MCVSEKKTAEPFVTSVYVIIAMDDLVFFVAFSSFLPLHEKDVSDEVVQMSRRTGVIFRFC